MTYRKTATIALAVIGTALAGCATRAQTGSLIGAGAGAAAGSLIDDGGATGTLVGGAVGAGAGYLIGQEMDRRAARERYYEDPYYDERDPYDYEDDPYYHDDRPFYD